MKLIVEAGSSKTDSVLISNHGKVISKYTTSGINPVSDKNHLVAVGKLCEPYKKSVITSIFYYGSGCINKNVNDKLASDIQSSLENSTTITVEDDLLAVARGLCQKNPGIAVILGTGSNIGYYDGLKIADRIKSSGYLLGDEGSGFRIGQAIYRQLARNQLSKSSESAILTQFNLTIDHVIPHLYKQQNPRQFLSSFSRTIADLNTIEQRSILNEVFDPFVERLVRPMTNKYKVPIHCSGSISFHFSKELKHKFEKFDIIAASFVQSPLEGLIRYHSNG